MASVTAGAIEIVDEKDRGEKKKERRCGSEERERALAVRQLAPVGPRKKGKLSKERRRGVRKKRETRKKERNEKTPHKRRDDRRRHLLSDPSPLSRKPQVNPRSPSASNPRLGERGLTACLQARQPLSFALNSRRKKFRCPIPVREKNGVPKALSCRWWVLPEERKKRRSWLSDRHSIVKRSR